MKSENNLIQRFIKWFFYVNPEDIIPYFEQTFIESRITLTTEVIEDLLRYLFNMPRAIRFLTFYDKEQYLKDKGYEI